MFFYKIPKLVLVLKLFSGKELQNLLLKVQISGFFKFCYHCTSNNFLFCSILAKNLYNFVSPILKTPQPRLPYLGTDLSSSCTKAFFLRIFPRKMLIGLLSIFSHGTCEKTQKKESILQLSVQNNCKQRRRRCASACSSLEQKLEENKYNESRRTEAEVLVLMRF